ncbi:MAG: hypothetical protein AAGB23_05110 [Pseudomonadota bacterium]
MTDEAKRIADGLSEAQRRAVADPKAVSLPSMGPKGYDSFILSFAHGRSAKALYRKGLSTLAWAPSILTPLGLAVRRILQEES